MEDEKISVNVLAEIENTIVYPADDYNRYPVFFEGKKVGTISDRDYGVALQWHSKDSFKTEKLTTIEKFLEFAKKFTDGKKIRKKYTYINIKKTDPSESLKRKVARNQQISAEEKEKIAKKIIGWLQKNKRYATEVSLTEIVGGIEEPRENVINAISELFKTHKVLQINSSHFRIHEQILIDKLPVINTRTNYTGKNEIIGAEDKKTIFDNIKKFSEQKTCGCCGINSIETKRRRNGVLICTTCLSKGMIQCNDCDQFFRKYEIHKGLCPECRKNN